MTQGDPFPSTVLNIVVDAVVREVMFEVYGQKWAHHELVSATGEYNVFFYADNNGIAVQKPIWVQEKTLLAVVCMVERVGLKMNPGKTKAMICTTGFIWGNQ